MSLRLSLGKRLCRYWMVTVSMCLVIVYVVMKSNSRITPYWNGLFSKRTTTPSSNNNLQYGQNELQGSIASDPPNIIFMMADDMGYGDVHYNGGTADTPNLDAMARGKHSVCMTRFYSGGPVCSPTRGTVLTGRNHNRYCIWTANLGHECSDGACPHGMPLPTSEITVAKILKQQNYRTAAFGKWHLGDLSPCPIEGSHALWPISNPGMHGFDTWWMTDRVTPTVDPNCECFNGTDCQRGHYGKDSSYCRNYHTVNPATGYFQSWPSMIHGDDSKFLFERVKAFVEHVVHNKERFFVYLAFHAPHGPYIATKRNRQVYANRGFAHNDADYYGTITGMDKVIGKIRQLLKSTGISNNTMLWFTSDNGPPERFPGSTGGLRGYKSSLFEGGIRVPGIIEWPAVIKHNFETQFPVVTSDLLPTVCDILNVSLPRDRDIDGISILPMLRREKESRDKLIMFMWKLYSPHVSNYSYFETTYSIVATGNRYKIHVLYRYGQIDEFFLYDLVQDRAETTDISDEKPQVVSRMKMEVEKWRLAVKQSAIEDVQCIEYSKPNSCNDCSSRSVQLTCDI